MADAERNPGRDSHGRQVGEQVSLCRPLRFGTCGIASYWINCEVSTVGIAAREVRARANPRHSIGESRSASSSRLTVLTSGDAEIPPASFSKLRYGTRARFFEV
jgi:hypothetical protein